MFWALSAFVAVHLRRQDKALTGRVALRHRLWRPVPGGSHTPPPRCRICTLVVPWHPTTTVPPMTSRLSSLPSGS